MRRQNPPQASLDQARNIEKYLSPPSIAAAYALGAAIYFGFVALLFAVMVHDYIVDPTPITIAIFTIVGVAPVVLTYLVWKRRPDDPLSYAIERLADSRRVPLGLTADRRTFKVRLMNGETLCVNLSFYYPEKNQTAELIGKLDMYARAALEQECSKYDKVPAEQKIEDTVDVALELVANEFDIPVLYVEITDLHKIRDAYSVSGDLAPSEFLGTGTVG
jgi:hypothetical protein